MIFVSQGDRKKIVIEILPSELNTVVKALLYYAGAERFSARLHDESTLSIKLLEFIVAGLDKLDPLRVDKTVLRPNLDPNRLDDIAVLSQMSSAQQVAARRRRRK